MQYELLQVLQKSERDLEKREFSENEKKIIQKYDLKNLSAITAFYTPPYIPTVPIVAIVGKSGSGKTTLATLLGFDKPKQIDQNLSPIDLFESLEEAEEKLSAVGLRSLPAWITSVKHLSVGERWRVEVAVALRKNCVLDEFSSVVDRRLAKTMSTCLRKYVDKHKLTNVIVCSCHRDFFQELRPEIVIDLDAGDVKKLTKADEPEIMRFDAYPANAAEWFFFAPHHYLTGKLCPDAESFVIYHGSEKVGFVSARNLSSDCRMIGHRCVILPEWQGLGIGKQLAIAHARYCAEKHNKILIIKSSQISFVRSLIATGLFRSSLTLGKIAFEGSDSDYIGRNRKRIDRTETAISLFCQRKQHHPKKKQMKLF